MNSDRMASAPSAASRSGIALVIILGMLSIMVLMGVAFSVSMRTERLAASAYADVIRARSLMDAALGRAVTEHLTDALEATGDFYPKWATDPFIAGGAGTNFMAGKGSNYVPRVLHSAAMAGDVLEWEDVLDPETGRFYGQYAYMIINNSGLVDANIIMASNRNYGVSGEELQVLSSIFPEATFTGENTGSSGSLGTWRDNWFKRFETVPELYSLGVWNASLYSGSIVDHAPPFRPLPGFYVDHFHVFSFNPTDTYVAPTDEPETFPRAFIGGPTNEWTATSTIVDILTTPPNAPFQNTPPGREQAAMFVDMLKDYASPGYVPSSTTGLNAKRVPKINEIAFSNTVELSVSPILGDPDTLTLRIHFFVETWFPYEYAPGIGAIPFEVSIGDPNNIRIDSILALDAGGNQVDITDLINEVELEGNTSEPIVPRHDATPGGAFRVTEFVFEGSIEVNCFDPTDCPPAPSSIGVILTINGPIQVVLGDDVVDEVAANWPSAVPDDRFQYASLNFTYPPSPERLLIGDVTGYSAFDPRFNWDPQEPLTHPQGLPRVQRQWDREPSSLGAMNPAAQQFSDAGNSDEFGIIYTAQRPIENVAELSYLLYSGDEGDPFKPWRTARLLGPDPENSAHIIDRFTVHTNAFRRGLVNINTPYVPVLQAAIHGAPIEPWRTGAGISSRVDPGQAEAIATAIVNDPARADGLRNLSGLAGLSGVDTATVRSMLDLDATANKFEMESVIRNTYGMLGTRDTMYTVFLITRTFPRGYDPDPSRSEIDIPPDFDIEDMVAAEQRAVALVWRDPAQDEDGAHRTFVRSFIWLTEDD